MSQQTADQKIDVVRGMVEAHEKKCTERFESQEKKNDALDRHHENTDRNVATIERNVDKILAVVAFLKWAIPIAIPISIAVATLANMWVMKAIFQEAMKR